ncbi:hypothetical protein AB0N05_12500 [Nocardia sp. NPDC051030]|uniref:hypothetical protein n=1 Tax=Nocardia sp. NPDC051030 TaxID=3155162 RepID=UPI003432C9A0
MRALADGCEGSLSGVEVDWTPDKMSLFVEGAARAAKRLGVTALPPLTGIGVAALAEPDLLVEIEATAILD